MLRACIAGCVGTLAASQGGCAGVRARHEARESYVRLERLLSEVRERARSSPIAAPSGVPDPEYVEVGERVLCVDPVAREDSLSRAESTRARTAESWAAVERALARGEVSDAGCGHDPQILLEPSMLVTVRSVSSTPTTVVRAYGRSASAETGESSPDRMAKRDRPNAGVVPPDRDRLDLASASTRTEARPRLRAHTSRWYLGLVSNPSERALRRMSSWSAEVVEAGTPKPRAYDTLSPEDRLRAFVALNQRVWETVYGSGSPRTPRSEWPGEIIDLLRS